MRLRFLSLAFLIAGVATTAQGQLLFDFESGLQDWGTSGFGNGTEFVGLSATGATEGSTQALAFGHDNGGFSWDGSWVIGNEPSDPTYLALTKAALFPVGATIEFDITYRGNDMPTFTSFANSTFSLQSDDGFKQVQLPGIGSTDPRDQTFNVSIPLDSGPFAGFTPFSSFYRLTYAFNSDSGTGTSTMYVDNIRLVGVIPEPSTALLALMGVAGFAARRR